MASAREQGNGDTPTTVDANEDYVQSAAPLEGKRASSQVEQSGTVQRAAGAPLADAAYTGPQEIPALEGPAS